MQRKKKSKKSIAFKMASEHRLGREFAYRNYSSPSLPIGNLELGATLTKQVQLNGQQTAESASRLPEGWAKTFSLAH